MISKKNNHSPFLVVTAWFPPRSGGTSRVLFNLLSWFQPDEYRVATSAPARNEARVDGNPEARVTFVSKPLPSGYWFCQLFNCMQILPAVIRVLKIIRRDKCRVLVGVFPDIQYLTIAYFAHRLSGIPLVIYQHDLIVENRYGGYLGMLACWIQPRVFRSASTLWTISDGLSKYLKEKYSVSAHSLPHCYNEDLPETGDFNDKKQESGYSVCFAGSVGAINAAALKRVAIAAGTFEDVKIRVTGHPDSSVLKRVGVPVSRIETFFMVDRAAFLTFIAGQDILLSCLSWPDESSVGKEELMTVFPTKIPEYLASGKPILVHCPGDYFLAKFMRAHDCAWVITERSEDALISALKDIRENEGKRLARRENALKAARLFSGGEISGFFREGLEHAAGGGPRILIPLAGFNFSGGVKVLVLIANEMAVRGWRVGFVCPDYAHIPGFPLHPSIKVSAVATGNKFLPKVFKKILFYLRLSLYDFSSAKFCLANYFPTALCVFIAKLVRFSRVTIIWYVQGFEAKSHGLFAQANPVSRICRYFLAHLSYRIPVPVLCVSRWVRTSIGRPDGVVVYPPSIDFTVFSPSKKEPVNGPCVIIGTIGRGGVTKGYDYFLKAIENLKKSLKIKILIASPDKKGVVVPDAFPAEIVEGNNERVMADFYNRCDVFVLSSLAEGFPLPVLEAMACGCPVITTACGGVSDYAEDGVNCLIVPPAQPAAMSEAIFRLYGDPGLRKKLAAGARETVRNFEKVKLLDVFIGAIVHRT